MLLLNPKEIIEDLQCKNVHFQTQVEKLTIENNKLAIKIKQLNTINKNLTTELNSIKEESKQKSIV